MVSCRHLTKLYAIDSRINDGPDKGYCKFVSHRSRERWPSAPFSPFLLFFLLDYHKHFVKGRRQNCRKIKRKKTTARPPLPPGYNAAALGHQPLMGGGTMANPMTVRQILADGGILGTGISPISGVSALSTPIAPVATLPGTMGPNFADGPDGVGRGAPGGLHPTLAAAAIAEEQRRQQVQSDLVRLLLLQQQQQQQQKRDDSGHPRPPPPSY